MSLKARDVLVVEDNLSNVRLLEAKLAQHGFAVHVALDGLAALSSLDERAFDLVVLDVMLPGIDGFEVCRAIRRHRLAAHTPVIMVTALDGASDRAAGIDAGADAFFVKPVEDEILFGCVEALIGRAETAA